MSSYSWTRLFWYYTWGYDDYPTDIPCEKDVLRKQVLIKQVGLSKLKMNKTKVDLKIPFDLQKIPDKALSQKQKQQGRLKIISPPSDSVQPPPPRNESQKQNDHKLSYCDRLKLLKNM